MAIAPSSLLQADFAGLAGAGAVAEVLELEERAHLDLALACVDRGVGVAPGPGERLLARLDVDDGVAGDELLGLCERSVDEGALAALRVLDAPALAARAQARAVHQDAGLGHLLVEPDHLGQQRLGRHLAGLAVPR